MKTIMPLLSVVTITYNHERWIAKTIEGVLAQKVDFPIEYIIAEDCSTDRTRDICEEYAAKYPDIIRLLPSDRNHGPIENEYRAIRAAKGKYIALCEGDDYWTEPLKLQRQVHFLEEHVDYSACFARCHHYYESTGVALKDNGDEYLTAHPGIGVDVDMKMFFHNVVSLMYLTVIYRRESLPDNLIHEFKYWRDTHLFYYLIKNGKCFLFSFFGGIRTVHDDSMTHRRPDDEVLLSVFIDKELSFANRDDKDLRDCYIASLRAAYSYFLDERSRKSLEMSNAIARVDKKYHRWVLRLIELLKYRFLCFYQSLFLV